MTTAHVYPVLLVPAATQNDGSPVPTLASEDAGEDVQHYGSDNRSLGHCCNISLILSVSL